MLLIDETPQNPCSSVISSTPVPLLKSTKKLRAAESARKTGKNRQKRAIIELSGCLVFMNARH